MLRLWSVQGDELPALTGHTGEVLDARELADDGLLSWALDHTLRLWSKDGNPLAVYCGDALITCCTLLRDGRFAVGEAGGRFYILRIEG